MHRADPGVAVEAARLDNCRKTLERIIGFKPGTGGSSGVGYLAHVLKKGFFPELISLRTAI
jgi:tryptophan 2,3-dioxygenase